MAKAKAEQKPEAPANEAPVLGIGTAVAASIDELIKADMRRDCATFQASILAAAKGETVDVRELSRICHHYGIPTKKLQPLIDETRQILADRARAPELPEAKRLAEEAKAACRALVADRRAKIAAMQREMDAAGELERETESRHSCLHHEVQAALNARMPAEVLVDDLGLDAEPEPVPASPVRTLPDGTIEYAGDSRFTGSGTYHHPSGASYR